MMTGIKEFLRLEAAGGIVLVVAAVLAMLVANSALSPYYESLLSVPFTITLGEAGISKPVLLWINDGLMAIFFFLIGLEIKREYLVGELSDPAKVMLPTFPAFNIFFVCFGTVLYFNDTTRFRKRIYNLMPHCYWDKCTLVLCH